MGASKQRDHKPQEQRCLALIFTPPRAVVPHNPDSAPVTPSARLKLKDWSDFLKSELRTSTCDVTDASNKQERTQNMKCVNYECMLSAMLLLLNYLHAANKMNIERRKAFMLLQMSSTLKQTVAASANFCKHKPHFLQDLFNLIDNYLWLK